MSLVDYASSSGEEDDDMEADATAAAPIEEPQRVASVTPADSPNQVLRAAAMQSNNARSSAVPAIELPDASFLFASSPSFSAQTIAGNDHVSRVAAAMSANASRKREANGTRIQFPQNKHPRGKFPPRYVPGRSSSLIPPQLLGRSNVVTEDVSKLFVNRRPPSQD